MSGYLAAIAATFVVVFGAAGLGFGFAMVRDARSHARTAAAFQAGLASRALDSTLSSAQAQVGALASNPAIPQVLSLPGVAECNLSFADLAFFPNGHLDVVEPDGRVVCSSSTADSASISPYRGAAWLDMAATATQSFVSEPFRDARTGAEVVAVVTPVRDTTGRHIGAVLATAPLAGTAHALSEVYGGPQRYRFSVSDARDRTLSGDNAVAAIRTDANGWIVGSGSVVSRRWHVVAGITTAAALGGTYSELLREGVLGALALLVVLAALVVVQRRIARPLKRLRDAVGDAGRHRTVIVGLTGPAEVCHLAAEFATMIASRDAYEAELSHQALHDQLTDLPNRALVADRLQHALDVAKLSRATVAVLFIDLDHFKVVNDSLGHSAGDQVLKTTADRLSAALPSGATVGRFGGDEFVIVYDTVDNTESVVATAQRLGDVIAQPLDAGDRTITVTASIGIAVGHSRTHAEDLIRDADTAMYVAKKNGRARNELFSEELHRQVTHRLNHEIELRAAIERGELHVVYQPKLVLATEETVGAEALLRWDHPLLGSVPPALFIPIAEETGLILPIGRFVLEQACQQGAEWFDGGTPIEVSVNISGRQITDGSLVEIVSSVLADTHLPPEFLCLELTESVLMTDATKTVRTLTGLKALGVSVSIDDFGTGYSSLAYLQQFQVDELKIDRSFVNDLINSHGEQTLVSAMVAMGKALGMRIVAEGVETERQAEHLRMLGCDLAQGYHYARPGPAELLTPLLRRPMLVRTAN